jgi:hypothetical protein
MSAKTNAPTIIKRKKVIAGGGHHGGAWKVAILVPLLWRFCATIFRNPQQCGLKRRSDGCHQLPLSGSRPAFMAMQQVNQFGLNKLLMLQEQIQRI